MQIWCISVCMWCNTGKHHQTKECQDLPHHLPKLFWVMQLARKWLATNYDRTRRLNAAVRGVLCCQLVLHIFVTCRCNTCLQCNLRYQNVTLLLYFAICINLTLKRWDLLIYIFCFPTTSTSFHISFLDQVDATRPEKMVQK